LAPGGTFLFDLNTAEGLKRWTGMSFPGDEEATLLLRGIRASGFGTIRIASAQNLEQTLEDPEKAGRIVFITGH
jgi:hypothetical protein